MSLTGFGPSAGEPRGVSGYGFEFAGVRHTFDRYGRDFLTELRRIAEGQVVRGGQHILEWGTGLSTLLLSDVAAQRGGLLVSVDHNAEYQAAVCRQVRHPASLKRFVVDLTGPTRNDSDAGLNYSTFPLTLGTDFALIFIDGRRRLECALVATQLCRADSLVVLHDYRRRRYQVVRALYDIVEDGRQFRVMRPKAEMLRSRQQVIAHYRT